MTCELAKISATLAALLLGQQTAQAAVKVLTLNVKGKKASVSFVQSVLN